MREVTRMGNLPAPVALIVGSLEKTLSQMPKIPSEITIVEHEKDSKKLYEIALTENMTIAPLISKDESARTYVVALGLPAEPVVDGELMEQISRPSTTLHFMEVSSTLLEDEYAEFELLQKNYIRDPRDLNAFFQLGRLMKRREQLQG